MLRLPRRPVLLVLGTILILLLGLIVGQVAARIPASAEEEPLDVLQPYLESITDGVPVGAVTEITLPTVPEWSSSAGVRDLRSQRAARPGDQVRIASVTKPMIATLVMQEVARGRWTLDTEAAQVLPRLFADRPGITLRRLLSHTSGLPDYLDPLLAEVTDPASFYATINRRYSDRSNVALALTLPVLGEPGELYSYSNTNYLTVGLMLKKVTGRSLGWLLEHRVFRPAGMDDSWLDRRPGISRRSLTEYAYLDLPDPSPARLYPLRRFHPTMASAAGAVVSTADDLSRFLGALLAGRLLPTAYVEQMLTPDALSGFYGLGIVIFVDPCPAPDGSVQYLYGHDGASLGTLTLALSSRDGSRRFVLSWTGRDHVSSSTPAVDEFALAATLAVCPGLSQTARREVRPDFRFVDADALDPLLSAS